MRPTTWRLIIAGLGVLVGAVLLALPHDWIETVFRMHPDHGSHALERSVGLAPLIAGLWQLGITALRRIRNTPTARHTVRS